MASYVISLRRVILILTISALEHQDTEMTPLQAVREADAAVEQATRLKSQKEAAVSEANSRVQSLIADLDRLQQSQSNLTPACTTYFC